MVVKEAPQKHPRRDKAIQTCLKDQRHGREVACVQPPCEFAADPTANDVKERQPNAHRWGQAEEAGEP